MLLNMFRSGVALGGAIEMTPPWGVCRAAGKVAPELCGCPLPEPAFRPWACPGATMLDGCCSEWNIYAPSCSCLSPTFVFSLKGTFEEVPAVNGIPRMVLFWQLQMPLSLT